MEKPIDIANRVRAVLVDQSVTSLDALTVLTEATRAFDALAPLVDQARERALDPMAPSAEAEAARAEMARLTFERDRLAAQVQAVQARVGVLKRQEAAATDRAFREAVAKRTDELAAELAKEVPALIERLHGYIVRIEQNDDEVRRANVGAPGEPLNYAEAIARGLPRSFRTVTKAMPRLRDCPLINWDGRDGRKFVWQTAGDA